MQIWRGAEATSGSKDSIKHVISCKELTLLLLPLDAYIYLYSDTF